MSTSFSATATSLLATATSAAAPGPTETKYASKLYNTESFITSFVINGCIAGGELLAWILLRRLIKAVYEPRTYIPPKAEQSPPLGTNLLKPLWNIYNADPRDILDKNGVDPYVFVRFLRLLARALVPIWFISWVVLFPVNAVKTNANSGDQLSSFTLTNVGPDERNRYWTHLCLAWLFNAWIMFLLWHEMKEWLLVRQRYLISKKHSHTAQASTILVTGIPKRFMDEDELVKLFSYLPGGVKRVWLIRDLAELPSLWKRRLEACKHLEKAQVELIQIAHKHQEKLNKKIAWYEKKGKAVPTHLTAPANPPVAGEPQSVVDRYVPRKDRPTIRLRPKWARFDLSFLGIGKKVDAIEWAREEIAQCTQALNSSRDQLARDIATPGIGEEYFEPLSSAFIRFNQQIAAHMAHQVLTYHEAYKMNNRFIEQSPNNVLWANTAIKSQYELNFRIALSYILTFGLIIAFAIPAAYASVLSPLLTQSWVVLQKDYVHAKKLWVLVVKGLVTGVAPPVLLAIILLIAPVFLRMLAQFHRVSKTEVELDVMTRYFVFLLINRFLVVTIVTLTTGDSNLNFDGWFNSKAVVDSFNEALTTRLPAASNFFIVLTMVQFTGTLFTLLQPISLITYYVRVILGGATPRKIYSSRYSMTYPEWGTEFPSVTIYFVIMMTYMVIAPVINGLGALFSIMSYFVYKYLCLWVWEQKPQMDTGGAFFPKAITQVFVGLYLQEICLAAYFFSRATWYKCLPQAILMVILVFVTIAVHYMLRASYHPLMNSVPLSLAHLSYDANETGDEIESDAESVISDTTSVMSVPERVNLACADDCDKEIATEELEVVGSAGSHDSTDKELVRATSATSSTVLIHEKSEKAEKQSGRERLREKRRERKERREAKAALRKAKEEERARRDWGDVHWCDKRHRWELHRIASGQSTHTYPPPCEADDDNDDDEYEYFAKPGGAGVLRTRDDGNDPAAFFHPATKDAQPVVWLPRDDFGIATEEMQGNVACGVLSTTKNAVFTHKGRVKVVGPAPDFL